MGPPPQPPSGGEIHVDLEGGNSPLTGNPAPPRYDGSPFSPWFPLLVPAIFVANVAAFIVTMYVNDCPAKSPFPWRCLGRRMLRRFSFEPFKANPLLGPSTTTLQKLGGLDVSQVVQQHQLWRLISCIWLHAGVIHILANMLSLLFIGIRLEQEFGFVRIGLLYIISGFGGSMLSALFMQSSISVGASGALFGLLGGMLSELITNWTIYANKLAALLTLLFIIAINLAVGILPHVDNFTHIGGFISGFLLGFVFMIRPQYGWIQQKHVPPGYVTGPAKPKHKMYQYILWILAVIFLIVWFTLGLVMLFRGVNANDHCSWCHYLSCVPTAKWSCKPSSTICYLSNNGTQVTVSCQGDGRNQSYSLPNATDDQLNQLCDQQCS